MNRNLTEKALSEFINLLTDEHTQVLLEGVLADNPGLETELNDLIEEGRSALQRHADSA